ncbi:hypothetical protein SEA_BUBBABEAR_58 [Microbacterium phage BubbaBear]|uniref:hypothetical protein n=1 Tax=Microbacterium phage BubbaBear TaxID=2572529 RepID=UPI0010C4C52A|nr:hypothetical protein QDW44_gp58 [Microbacterium phage BubbaBear]YP_010754039.1 hypothetical protein QDW46_gp60 [Microbacterium phage SansAfet]QCG77319.1 hypothetical protein SEA_BUBBABEAR_58 [Microbacterium phage BubbaBear]QFP94315.1 hypothetical protein SEA_SANSAFET_60 [Microbacterium phage SansAfet]
MLPAQLRRPPAKAKRLFGMPGVVVDTFDMPPAVRTRVTTLAVLSGPPGSFSPQTFWAFKKAYEKRSRRHRVVGSHVDEQGGEHIILAYSGKSEEDLGQIRAWLERRILNWYSLNPGVYTLRYWNDPERPAST